MSTTAQPRTSPGRRGRGSARGSARAETRDERETGGAADRDEQYDLLTAAMIGLAVGAGAALLLRRGPGGSRPIAPAARAVASGECELGIVLGGSGTGEQIVANKIRGIRCVEATEPVTARLAREHNDANVLSMGARIVGVELAP